VVVKIFEDLDLAGLSYLCFPCLLGLRKVGVFISHRVSKF